MLKSLVEWVDGRKNVYFLYCSQYFPLLNLENREQGEKEKIQNKRDQKRETSNTNGSPHSNA